MTSGADELFTCRCNQSEINLSTSDLESALLPYLTWKEKPRLRINGREATAKAYSSHLVSSLLTTRLCSTLKTEPHFASFGDSSEFFIDPGGTH